MSLLDTYLELPVDHRHKLWTAGAFTPGDEKRLAKLGLENVGSPYAIFQDDPVGFCRVILNENVTEVQREIMESIRDNDRTSVPSCFGSGKTHVEGRAPAWWACVWPPGTAATVLTATRMNQVLTQTWPHLRRLVANAGLPGDCQATQWMFPRYADGLMERVAWGYTPPAYDPEAVQGLHFAHVLVLLDEGGGFAHEVGNAWLSATTGLHTRIAVFGNPPIDAEDSWLERISTAEGWNTIHITADRILRDPARYDQCRSCIDWKIRPHPIGDHLMSEKDRDRFISDFGEDSAYVQSKVYARFVKGAVNKVVPAKWFEEARIQRVGTDVLHPDGGKDELERLRRDGKRIRLGVDIAGKGGDELVVARKEGRVVRITLTQAGEANTDAVAVAGYILEEIKAAQLLARKLDLLNPIEVCLDVSGMGWGPVSTLQAWGKEGRHKAIIVGIDMGEAAEEQNEYINRRAEMWWAMRLGVKPLDDSGLPLTYYDIDDRTAGQIVDPTWKTDSHGRYQIESVEDMAKRGRNSPDRATACALAEYRPHSLFRGKRKVIIAEGSKPSGENWGWS